MLLISKRVPRCILSEVSPREAKALAEVYGPACHFLSPSLSLCSVSSCSS